MDGTTPPPRQSSAAPATFASPPKQRNKPAGQPASTPKPHPAPRQAEQLPLPHAQVVPRLCHRRRQPARPRDHRLELDGPQHLPQVCVGVAAPGVQVGAEGAAEQDLCLCGSGGVRLRGLVVGVTWCEAKEDRHLLEESDTPTEHSPTHPNPNPNPAQANAPGPGG